MGLFSFLNKKRQQFSVGSKYVFGKYVQDNSNKKKPIGWMILSIKENIALLIADKCLICSGYCDLPHETNEKFFMKWKHSLARRQCLAFKNEAFTEKESEALVAKNICDNTSDFVFLLSQEEVERYLPSNDSRKAKPTEYALSNGACLGLTDDTREYTGWWILPENETQPAEFIYPKAVFQNGNIQFHSRNAYHTDFTIRPAILLDINKL